MFSRPFAVAVLALACVTAAAGGAYVAVRQNHSADRERSASAIADVSLQGGPAVQETEAVVASTPGASVAEKTLEAPAQLAESATPVESDTRGASRPTPARPVRRERASSAAVRHTGKVQPQPPSQPAAGQSVRATEAAAPPAATPTPDPGPAPSARAEALAAPAPAEPARSKPAPRALPVVEEVVIPASAVMGLRIETPMTSERARIEDRVEARVTRDVSADGRTAIPAGTRVIGAVTLVERGGKVKERARLEVRFHTLVLADGTELPLRTEPILREGESPAGESSRKIGGAAVGGAILGAIMGGKKGAIVGGATGAAGGTAVVMAGDRNAAALPVGAVVTVRLSAPLVIERTPE
jgi:hypothetical protein